MICNSQLHRWPTVLAAVAVCLATSWAFAQSGSRSETGATPGDLSLSGPANNVSPSPAPAAEIEFPSVDDVITKGVPKTQSIDSFIAGDPPAIVDLDPQRQGKAAPAADLSPQPALDDTPKESGAADQPHVVAKPTGDGHGDVAPSQLEGGTATLEQRVARLEAALQAQSATLQELRTAQAQLLPAEELKAIREEIAALRNSFQSVGRPDFDSGTADSQPALTKVGTLIVENRTGFGYTMKINGYDYVIMPGRREIPVKVGKVVTELRGFEAPRAWSPDNFREVNGEPQLAIQIR